jgi:hypothetical protein
VTTLVTIMEYSSKEVRDAAMSAGMTDGMEFNYQRLDELLAGERGRPRKGTASQHGAVPFSILADIARPTAAVHSDRPLCRIASPARFRPFIVTLKEFAARRTLDSTGLEKLVSGHLPQHRGGSLRGGVCRPR